MTIAGCVRSTPVMQSNRVSSSCRCRAERKWVESRRGCARWTGWRPWDNRAADRAHAVRARALRLAGTLAAADHRRGSNLAVRPDPGDPPLAVRAHLGGLRAGTSPWPTARAWSSPRCAGAAASWADSSARCRRWAAEEADLVVARSACDVWIVPSLHCDFPFPDHCRSVLFIHDLITSHFPELFDPAFIARVEHLSRYGAELRDAGHLPVTVHPRQRSAWRAWPSRTQGSHVPVGHAGGPARADGRGGPAAAPETAPAALPVLPHGSAAAQEHRRPGPGPPPVGATGTMSTNSISS